MILKKDILRTTTVYLPQKFYILNFVWASTSSDLFSLKVISSERYVSHEFAYAFKKTEKNEERQMSHMPKDILYLGFS